MRLKKVRNIRFGIRFKFSLVMIAGMVFVSALIGIGVYNQHERKIQDSLQFLGSTIVKGAAEDARKYLVNKHYLYSKKGQKLSPHQKAGLKTKIRDSYDNMKQYISSVVKKEKMLDIAFLIDINWKDTDFSLKKIYNSQFLYFHRTTGNFFVIDNKAKSGFSYNITWKSGRFDDQLRPTIYKHYMQNIDPKPYLIYAEGRKEAESEFIIIGVPIYKNNNAANLFKNYYTYQNNPVKQQQFSFFYSNGIPRRNPVTISSLNINNNRDIINLRNREKKHYKKLFLKRIITNEMEVNYDISISHAKANSILKSFISFTFKANSLKRKIRTSLYKDISEKVYENINKGQISYKQIKNIIRSLKRKYRLSVKDRYENNKLWISLYQYLNYKKIPIDTKENIHQLALISHRKDLSGVMGLFLHKREFYGELQENGKELFNLILSILLRAIFIALFFPTFIIRTISKLADGALEIGKGNLDKKIEIKGTDELGRLSDILNVMTLNLKKAQDDKLIKQRMEAELLTAQQIQSALLPESLPDIKGLSFGAFYAAQTESGGDYYDFIELDDNRLGIVIADVSGHGVGSGLVMSMTRTLLHIYCKQSDDIKKIFLKINEYLYENTASNFFVTVFFGILNLDTKKLTYASAGHNPSIILRKNKITELPAGGIALGAVGNHMVSNLITVKNTTLEKGDYFIQATDGVEESMDAQRNEFGIERFHMALLKNKGKNPQSIIDCLVEEINIFTKKIPQHDDITIISLKID